MNKKENKLIISGTGCALADYLYTNIRFHDPAFQKYLSIRPGDGGLSPGKLVFTEEIEAFAKKPYMQIIKDLNGNKASSAFNVGGPGLVSMINASQLLDREHFEVKFYGGMGTDKIAERILQNLNKKIPLDITNYKAVSDKPTPSTHVLSDPTFNKGRGERTFINNIGAAWHYQPDDLMNDFFNAHLVCFGGTALVPHIHDQLPTLLREARRNNCRTVVNTVFDFRNEKVDPVKPWPLCDCPEDYKNIDLLIMDAEEAMRISGAWSLVSAAMFFVEMGVAAFIITNGADEFLAFSNGTVFQRKELSNLPVSAQVTLDLVRNPSLKGDTTGCGDNFAGGAIASFARQLKYAAPGDLSFDEVLSWAVASGGFACFYHGGTYFEKKPGEKYTRIEDYKNEYLKQVLYFDNNFTG